MYSLNRFWIFLMLTGLLSLAAQAEEPNQLTSAEQASGWRLLFDGTSPKGWRSFHGTSFPAKGWKVEDGWLKCVAGGHGGDIITTDQFENFELTWEWRLPPKSNNGVKYFITEARKQAIGHEYQMVDNSIEPRSKCETASFYDVLAPAAHPPIQFAPGTNHSRIIVQGNHVEHWLNGQKVLEYECGSPQVREAVAQSKFKNVSGFGQKITGHILLTEHHDEAWFRNIKLRVLAGNQRPE